MAGVPHDMKMFADLGASEMSVHFMSPKDDVQTLSGPSSFTMEDMASEYCWGQVERPVCTDSEDSCSGSKTVTMDFCTGSFNCSC